jgi:hypothetical protein
MKCIFNKTTGQIYAICTPEQDFQSMLDNYANADWIEINSGPGSLRNFTWRVNPDSRELET